MVLHRRPLERSHRIESDTPFPPCIPVHYSLSSRMIPYGTDTTGGFKSSSLESTKLSETAKSLYVEVPHSGRESHDWIFTTGLLARPCASTGESPRFGSPPHTSRRQTSDSRGRIVGVEITKLRHWDRFPTESPQSNATLEIVGRLVESLGGMHSQRL